MYIGLGQFDVGSNPCGMGYAFINFQCVRDPNCDFSGGSGIGFCPQNYHPPAYGTLDDPASPSEAAARFAKALVEAQAVTQAALEAPAPVQTTSAAAIAPSAPSVTGVFSPVAPVQTVSENYVAPVAVGMVTAAPVSSNTVLYIGAAAAIVLFLAFGGGR